MPFLQFLPWCPVDTTYDVGEITLVPFAADAEAPGVGEREASQVRTVLSAYRRIDGRPVRRAALIRYDCRPFLAEVSKDEMAVTRELVELACVSGLAKRALFDLFGPYCNADCFVWYGQRFDDKLDYAGIVHRRRDGETLDLRSLDRTLFSAPLHVGSISDVTLDSSLLAALLKFKESAEASEWGRWQNAISCFKHANTDSEAVSPQVEWVLTCGAFEQLLQAPSKAKEIARLFSETLRPTKSISADGAKRTSPRKNGGRNLLRYEWMSEFYRIRGDFAHGKLQTGQPLVWTQWEHLVLASISFPLCMKALLQQKGHYSLTEDDQAQTDAFESLADQDGFLAEPPDSSGSGGSWWRRCLMEARRVHRRQKAIESLRALNGNSEV